MRNALMGISVSAGPSMATKTARTKVAITTPYHVERQPRVVPIANTIVKASTPSTMDAKNTLRTSKMPCIENIMAYSFSLS